MEQFNKEVYNVIVAADKKVLDEGQKMKAEHKVDIGQGQGQQQEKTAKQVLAWNILGGGIPDAMAIYMVWKKRGGEGGWRQGGFHSHQQGWSFKVLMPRISQLKSGTFTTKDFSKEPLESRICHYINNHPDT